MRITIQRVFACLYECAVAVVLYSPMLYYDSNIFNFARADSVLMFTKRKSISKHGVEYVNSRPATCPDLPAPDVSLYNNVWQQVSNSKELFLYSGFVDDDKIRLIAIGKDKVDVLTCQIWSKNTSLNTIVVEKYPPKLEKLISNDEHNRSYTTFYVDCPLPTHGVPYAVSIAAGNLTCQDASNSFLLETSGKVKKGNFSACVPPVFGNYPTPHHLIQWIETNRLLGVQFFTFYNAGINPNSVLWKVFEKYVKEQIIEMLQWHIPTPDIHSYGQIASINDCLYRHSKRFKYTAFIDLDELIIPRIPTDMTWSDMLKRLPNGCSYSFRKTHYQYNYTNASSNKLSRDFIFNKSFVVNSARRQSYILKQGLRSKVIVKSKEVERFGIHKTLKCKDGKVIRRVDRAIGMVHHYRFNTKNADVRDNTTLKYMSSLRKQLGKSPIFRDV